MRTVCCQNVERSGRSLMAGSSPVCPDGSFTIARLRGIESGQNARCIHVAGCAYARRCPSAACVMRFMDSLNAFGFRWCNLKILSDGCCYLYFDRFVSSDYTRSCRTNINVAGAMPQRGRFSWLVDCSRERIADGAASRRSSPRPESSIPGNEFASYLEGPRQ